MSQAHTKKPAAEPERNATSKSGYDGAGHMDPGHAARLADRAREAKASEEDVAFPDVERDDLAEELGEAAVESMTSGEDDLADELDAQVSEEGGGPFVTTSAETEFAAGTDKSNIKDAEREPLPKV